jgi:hypothetical protein
LDRRLLSLEIELDTDERGTAHKLQEPGLASLKPIELRLRKDDCGRLPTRCNALRPLGDCLVHYFTEPDLCLLKTPPGHLCDPLQSL